MTGQCCHAPLPGSGIASGACSSHGNMPGWVSYAYQEREHLFAQLYLASGGVTAALSHISHPAFQERFTSGHLRNDCHLFLVLRNSFIQTSAPNELLCMPAGTPQHHKSFWSPPL